MRPSRATALGGSLVATVLLAAGCSLPHERTETGASKIAITQVDAEAIYARYARVRRSALRLLDPQPLTSIETGPVLAIDSGALQVARRLLLTEKVDDNQNLEIQQVLAPRLTSYPLWFVAVVRDGVRKLTKVQIFTRETSVSTWQLVASPETLTTVDLPGFAVDDQGALAPVAPDDDNGLSLSPADAVTGYVGALNAASGAEENGQDDPAAAARAAKRAQDQELGGSSDLPDPGGDGAAGSSPQPAPTTGGGPGGSDDETDPSRLIVRDSFITQMATIARQQSSIGGVRFAQQWQAQPVEYALRTADGGALVFADLLRVDAYSLSEGTVVNWPEGSEQQAFLTGKLYSGGQLSYIHQVLFYLPPEGGKLRAIGQYGGVVDASGS